MAGFKSGIITGVLIGIIGTTTVGNININSTANNTGEINYSKYETSDFYRSLAPSSSNNYYIETPLLNALIGDIQWDLKKDSKTNYFYYEGVFKNWTDLKINQVIFELSLLSKDGTILDTTKEYINDIESGDKILVKIRIPYEYQDEEMLKDIKFKVTATSRDFKDIPFTKK